MPKLSRDDAVNTLVNVVRDALAQGESIHIPDLGTFSVKHRPSHTQQRPDGHMVMQPPRNEVVFTPDN